MPEVWNVPIPMSDGVVLAGNVRLPDGPGPFPVLVSYYPYLKDGPIGAVYEHSNRYFAAHGYATLFVDFRGLGCSAGDVMPAFHDQEGRDGYDIVEWAAAQEWCDGSVGMWGLSYGAITAYKTARLKPPHLAAIVPLMGFAEDSYGNLIYPGGCLNMRDMLAQWGPMMLALSLLPPLHQDPDGAWRARWRERLERTEPYMLDWRYGRERDASWPDRSTDAAPIEVPAYAIGGWDDLYPEAMTGAHARLRAPRRLLMGPWNHAEPHLGRPHPIEHLPEMLRWWDRWLKREDNGIDAEPEVRLFVRGEERWVQTASWPPAADAVAAYRLSADGALVPDDRHDDVVEGVLMHTTDPTTGVTVGIADTVGSSVGGTLDQGPDDLRSLTFTSAPLEADLRLVGAPRIALDVSLERGDDLHLVVKLCDVAPDGTSSLVTTGWRNAKHRDGDAAPVPLGERVRYAIDLWPTAYLLRTGHALRVSIGGADFPRIWPTRRNPTIAVTAGAASRLVLPIAPDAVLEDWAPVPAAPDVDRAPLAIDGGAVWEIVQRPPRGEVAVETAMSYTVRDVAGDGRLSFELRGTATVQRERPDRATAAAHAHATCEKPGAPTVEVTARTLVTGHDMSLHASVTVGGTPFFERIWRSDVVPGASVETPERETR